MIEHDFQTLSMDSSSADGGIVAEIRGRHGHSAQPESQQVLAVLQAVLEVIAAESMSATPTTIFAALMSALERPDAQSSPAVSTVVLLAICTQQHPAGNPAGAAVALQQRTGSLRGCFLQTALAMCTLLGTALSRVPNGVLRSKFVGSVQLLGRLVEQHRQQVRLVQGNAELQNCSCSSAAACV